MEASEMIGKSFNYLTVLKRTESIKRHIMVKCICKCGNSTTVRWSELKNGRVKSCGCHPIGRAAMKEGTSYRTPEYNAWAAMLARCRNPKNKKYYLYGGRGVSVCERWLVFKNFLADVGLRPSDQHSLDRYPDKDGNYEPNNFRWATIDEQNRNTNRNVYLEYEGRLMVLQDWAAELKVDPHAISVKLNAQKNFKEIFEYYLNKKRR